VDDRDAGLPVVGHAVGAGAGPGPLREALERLRLDGAIFFRAEFTEPWAFDSPVSQIVPVIRPGARRLIFFHIVAVGRCWVALEDGTRVWANRGDVIVMPYGDDYSMGGEEPAERVPILSLVTSPPWEQMPVLTHGAGGPRTDVVCGYLHSGDPLFDPALRALPAVFVVRLPDGPAAQWVEMSIRYALVATAASTPAETFSTRLPELVLIEVLRIYLAGAPAADHGWIAALHDAVLAPALGHLHAAPERKWTVTSLAASVAVSRSVLDERFRSLLGCSPIRYLTEWRMHVADGLLVSTDEGIASIARRVGYDSEEAFSRAFKRHRGSAPGAWRASRQAPRASA
jgi:AraC-like DNA-binding protein